MSLPSLSVKRPVLATVASLTIVLFGLVSYWFLSVREYPSIDPPVISVGTSYTGANPDVIESQITEPLEKAINSVAGIKSISSQSANGRSTITVEFELNSDLSVAANDIRDKVAQAVRLLPADIDAAPVVIKADANAGAIAGISIKSDTRKLEELSDYAENVIGERVQTIPGVSSVQIWGQKRYAMRIWLLPEKLTAFKITPADVRNALAQENVDLPSGSIEGNQIELSVRTYGRLSTPDEFENIIIRANGNNFVRLKDIAVIELSAANIKTIFKDKGIPNIGIGLVPQPGSNQIEILDEFYKRLEVIKKDLPPDIHIDLLIDNTIFIRNAIKDVQETILIAFLLVTIVLYLFFRDWKMSLRPLVDIPVSLIGAFFIMYIFGYSINVLTLLAVVLATGIVVDDGIVVAENIFKKREHGYPTIKATIMGAEEIQFAVVATSVTLAMVFLPLMFMQGFVGRLFREFSVVVAGSVLISAFVSLTLTVMLNSKIDTDPEKTSKFYRWSKPFYDGLDALYARYLQNFMKRRWIAFVIVIVSMLLCVLIYFFLPAELAPLEDRGRINIASKAQEGATYDYMLKYMDKYSEISMKAIPEANVVVAVTAPGFAGSGATNTGFGFIGLIPFDQRKRSLNEIIGDLNKQLSQVPDAVTYLIPIPTISTSSGRDLPVQFVLQNNDFEKFKKFLPTFMTRVKQSKVFSVSDVNLVFNRPELFVVVDRNKANSLGVSVQDIAQALQLSYGGVRYGYFIKSGKQYDVIAQMTRQDRDKPLDLRSLYVRSKSGTLIQLDNVVKISEQSSPPQIYHYNRYKSATISAGLAPGMTIADGVKEMQKIAKEVLDESFVTTLSGQSRDFAESASNTMLTFIFALIMIYLILAAQFESFIDPFVVLITVPTALFGALLFLWYFNQTFNIFGQIGIIVLIGLVAKNGILIVEFANQKKEQGLNTLDAVIEAAKARMRPVLMTSIITVLGAFPIAFAFGSAATSRISMGIVIIGGLLISTFLTLFIVPAVYSYVSQEHKKIEIE